MNGIEKATEELCSTCHLNEMGLCNPLEDVCYNFMLLSVAYLLTEQRKAELSEDEGA